MTNQRFFDNILASASQVVHCSPLFYKDCLEIGFSARSFGSIASLLLHVDYLIQPNPIGELLGIIFGSSNTYKLVCIFPPTFWIVPSMPLLPLRRRLHADMPCKVDIKGMTGFYKLPFL